MDVYIFELKTIPNELGGQCHYAQLLDEVLRSAGQRPLGRDDIKKRLRIRKSIKKAVERAEENVVLSVDEGQLVKEAAASFPWGLALEHIGAFLDDIENAKKVEDYQLHGAKGGDGHDH